MSIIKMADLNRRMTEVVAQYINKGLTFVCEAMSGSQGEIGKVAVGNDKHVYIVYLHNDYTNNDWIRRKEVVKLTVELHLRDDRNTYWLGRGETVQEEVFYLVNSDRYYEKVYTDSKDEADAIYDKHSVRFKNSSRYCPDWKEMKYNKDTVVAVIKAKTGRKRVFTENIVKVEKHTTTNAWKVTYIFAGRQDSLYVKATA